MRVRFFCASAALIVSCAIAAETGGGAPTPVGDVGSNAPAQVVSDSEESPFGRAQRARFDALAASDSPRTQILASRVFIPAEEGVPVVLRAAPSEIIARAVGAAADDATVQWIAATHGTYESSLCAPIDGPDNEVGNLVRLEPDNAGAWIFAVALAEAGGDDDAVDDALARMASASQATSHLVDMLDTWTHFFDAHRALIDDGYTPFDDYTFPTSDRARLAALLLLDNGSPLDESLQSACAGDGSSERTWRRIGLCSDAGYRLAEHGDSIVLRRAGILMLKAAGADDARVATAEREIDWLDAHSANPDRHFFDDDPEDLPEALSDWRGADGEIAATRHRLARLGLPATPPPGWVKPEHVDEGDPARKAARQAWSDYITALFADLRGGASPLGRAYAAAHASYAAYMEGDGAFAENADAAGGATLAALANAYPSNLAVQWAAAQSTNAPAATKAAAIARVQASESDNGAAWALSLGMPSPSSVMVDQTLRRIAQSARFDTHAIAGTQVMADAMERRPLPPGAEPIARELGRGRPADDIRLSALSISQFSFGEIGDILNACSPAKDAPSRRDACVAIGRLLVRSGVLTTDVDLGVRLLRRADALDEADADRARRVHWWAQVLDRNLRSQDVGAYVDEFVGNGNEVRALGINAAARGKLDPPSNWNPRALR